MTKRRKRRWWWYPAMAAGAAAAWALGDFTYQGAVRVRYRRWEDGIERDPDGVRRGCREFEIGAGDTAILMVHGYGDSPAIWRPLAERLAAAGIYCRAMRLPRFCLPMEQYRKTDADQWLAAVREQLGELRGGHDRVLVAGHSLGGAIAINILLADIDAADGLVLLTPLIRLSGKRSPILTPAMWHHLAELTLHWTDYVENWFDHSLHDSSQDHRVLSDRFIPRSVIRGLFRLVRENGGTRPRDLRLPLLVFASGDDPVVDNDATRRFVEMAGSRCKQLIVYEDAGHCLPVEAAVDDMADRIRVFAAGV